MTELPVDVNHIGSGRGIGQSLFQQPNGVGAVGKARPRAVAAPGPTQYQVYVAKGRVGTHLGDELVLRSPRLCGLGSGRHDRDGVPLPALSLKQTPQRMAWAARARVNTMDDVEDVHNLKRGQVPPVELRVDV